MRRAHRIGLGMTTGLIALAGGCSSYVPMQQTDGTYQVERQYDPNRTGAALLKFGIGGIAGNIGAATLNAASDQRNAQLTQAALERLEKDKSDLEAANEAIWRVLSPEQKEELRSQGINYSRPEGVVGLRTQYTLEDGRTIHGRAEADNSPDYALTDGNEPFAARYSRGNGSGKNIKVENWWEWKKPKREKSEGEEK